MTLEVLIAPLADFLRLALGFIGPLQHTFDDKPQKPPRFLRPLIGGITDYRKLALIAAVPLWDCMAWGRDDPCRRSKLYLKVGAELEAQLQVKQVAQLVLHHVRQIVEHCGARVVEQYNAAGISGCSGLDSSWTDEQRLRAGGWLVSNAIALDLFEIVDGFPQISAKWQPEFDRIREEMIRAYPAHMPVFEPPPDWTGWWSQCPDRVRVPFVRKDWWLEHRAAVIERFKDPEWEHPRAVSAIQRVPFKIDHDMRLLVEHLGPDAMDHVYQKRWDDERTVADDISVAKYIGDRAFYIPRNCDKRGRINSVCHFNYERGDHVRSLIKFANGMRLGGHIEPLEIHCANCWGATDKERFSKRRKWCTEHREDIQDIAKDPFGTFDKGVLDGKGWKDAVSPFCFVAACRELAAAWKDPENFVTHLPVGLDGTANGLQHLALLIRDPIAGQYVNLVIYIDEEGRIIRDLDPQDIYGIVAARTKELIRLDDNDHARWWRDRLDLLKPRQVRKLLKTTIMAYAYSVTLPGATEHIAEAYKELKQNEWPGGGGFRYLAEKVLEACRLLLPGPAKVMDRIRDLAKDCLDHGQFLKWVSPSGFPVLNRYHEPNEPKTFNLITYGKRVRHDLAIEFKEEIWETKTLDAASPNFVHSLDASHLVRVVNAANREGITDILTVHDCYYFLAPQAARGKEIILDQLWDMYDYSKPLDDLHTGNVSNPDLFPVPPRGVEARWADGARILMPDGRKARMVLPRAVTLAESAFG